MKSYNPTIPKRVKAEVLKIDDQAEVIAIDPKTRGDFNAESDWDFLILLSEPNTFEIQKSIWDELYEIELESEQMITSFIEEKSKWEKLKSLPMYQNLENQRLETV